MDSWMVSKYFNRINYSDSEFHIFPGGREAVLASAGRKREMPRSQGSVDDTWMDVEDSEGHVITVTSIK